MAQDLFRDVVDPSIKVGGNKRYTVSSSIVLHGLVLAFVFLLPLLAPDVLPMPPAMLAFVAPPPAPVVPPPPPPLRADVPRQLAHDIDLDAAPIGAPRDIAAEPSVAASPSPTSELEAVPGALSNGAVEVVMPPPPPATVPPAPQPPSAPVRLSTGITRPTKTRDVTPVYPAVALAARVQGVVILEVTIATSGRVEDVKVLRSLPLLDHAAIDAVRQWEYAPTLFNGTAVPLVMTVTVTFALQ